MISLHGVARMDRQVAALRHHAVRALDRDRHDGTTLLDRCDEGALLERQELAVAATRTFGKDDDRVALLPAQFSNFDRLHRVFTIQGQHAERTHYRAEHRLVEQILLGGEAVVAGQVAEQGGNVDVGLVIRR
jgi:hypothetical protein